MKRILLLILFVSCANGVFAQAITIDQNDFANAGDTVRVSVGVANPFFDITTTGASQVWNFSNLTAVSQRVDTFKTVASTDPIYSLVFANVQFNPNRANIAMRGADLPAAGGLAITDVFNFYYKTATHYKQVGIGAKINTITTPVPFTSHDTIYNFPLDFGNSDSSLSGFTVNLPNLLFYQTTQKRVNVVDGWGMLSIPLGTFPVLRVKSVITATDSLYIDSLAQGFNITRPTVTEYKWIGKQQLEPLLQVNTQTLFNVEVVSSVVYRDSARSLVSVPELVNAIEGLAVYPNPASDAVLVTFGLTRNKQVSWVLSDIQGKTVRESNMGRQESGMKWLAVDGLGQLARGSYLLTLCAGADCLTTRILLTAEF